MLWIRLIIFSCLCFACNIITANPNSPLCDDDFISILAIDGGKKAGIMPLNVLKKLEKDAELNIATSFDFMAASSFGALTIALLTMPNNTGNAPLYSIDDAMKLYTYFIEQILYTSTWHKIRSLWGGIAPMRNSIIKDKLTERYFKNTKIKQLLSHVMLFVINLTDQKVITFSNWGNANNFENLQVKDVIDGSTAVMRKFPPKSIIQKNKTLTLSDATIAINNSTANSFLSIYTACPHTKHFVILSLGTAKHEEINLHTKDWGFIEWMFPAIAATVMGENFTSMATMMNITYMLNQKSKIIDDEFPHILYIRVEPKFNPSSNANNPSEHTIDYYRGISDEIIAKNEPMLNCIAQFLKVRDYKKLNDHCLQLLTQQRMTTIPNNINMLGVDFLTQPKTGIIFVN